MVIARRSRQLSRSAGVCALILLGCAMSAPAHAETRVKAKPAKAQAVPTMQILKARIAFASPALLVGALPLNLDKPGPDKDGDAAPGRGQAAMVQDASLGDQFASLLTIRRDLRFLVNEGVADDTVALGLNFATRF